MSKAKMGVFFKRRKGPIFNYWGWKCVSCSKKCSRKTGITIDHFIPKSKGGYNNIFNIVPMCKECNLKKADTLPDAFFDNQTMLCIFNYFNFLSYYFGGRLTIAQKHAKHMNEYYFKKAGVL